jgi:thiosulfate/3-mercaptopyruvate sulfurtransferase
VDIASLSCEVDGVPGMLLPPERYAEAMSHLGIGPETTVIAYDDNRSMPASRLVWGLLRYGHKNAAILEGGWNGWLQHGYPITQDEPPTFSAHFVPQPDDSTIAELAWLRSRIGMPDFVLIDTRRPDEYAQGHIPGAIHWEWVNSLLDGTETLRPDKDVRAELEALGITPDKEIVTYCRSGARASHTFLLLRRLGYPRVRNYDGSWLEWSARELSQ